MARLTINDLELSELITQINLKAACLNTWCREGKSDRLFLELSDIEMLSHKAEERLNKLRWHPAREPMGS